MIIPIYFSNKIEYLFSFLPNTTISAKISPKKKKVRFILQPEYIFYETRYGYEYD